MFVTLETSTRDLPVNYALFLKNRDLPQLAITLYINNL
jgi:hypothetical protein